LYSVSYQNQNIPFKIVPSRGRSLTIKIGLDQTVLVRAPKYVGFNEIAAFVQDRAKWVAEKRAEFALLQRPTAEVYEQGAWVSLLGEKYQIVVNQADINLVTLHAQTLQVKVLGEISNEKIAKLVMAWYREQALSLFTERMRVCYQSAAQVGIRAFSTLQIRKMKSRWGSCRRSGNITLNLTLIKLPLAVIDYVIMHELCHLKEFNHSSAFYALLDQAMPDWQKQRQILFQYTL